MAGSGTSCIGHKQFVHAVAFRPDGKCLATLGDEGTIRVWDTGSGRPLQDHQPEHTRVVESREIRLSWSPDGRRLASTDGRRPRPDLGSRDRTGDGPDRPESPIRGLEPGRDPDRPGRPVTSGWRSAPGTPGPTGCTSLSSGNRARSNTLCWSPDGRRLAATWTLTDGGSPKWRLTVWDATSGEEVCSG